MKKLRRKKVNPIDLTSKHIEHNKYTRIDIPSCPVVVNELINCFPCEFKKDKPAIYPTYSQVSKVIDHDCDRALIEKLMKGIQDMARIELLENHRWHK